MGLGAVGGAGSAAFGAGFLAIFLVAFQIKRSVMFQPFALGAFLVCLGALVPLAMSGKNQKLLYEADWPRFSFYNGIARKD